MNIITTSFLSLLLIILLGGCGDSPFLKTNSATNTRISKRQSSDKLQLLDGAITINMFWREGPKLGGESKLLLVLTDIEGRPYTPPYELFLKLWMPKMSPPHGSAKIRINELSPGVYEASFIYFTMPGYWDLHIQLRKNKNVLMEVLWNITL